MFKLDFKKAEEPEIKLPTSNIKKAREFQKNIYLCFMDYVKAFGYVDHNKLENSSKDRNIRSPYLLLEKSVFRSRGNS